MIDIAYAVVPFLAWLVAGALKFSVNSVRARRLAFGLIGYGGLPSNHSAIVSALAALIAFREGISHPAFGIAVTLAFIVILDAAGLRRTVGLHASTLNRLEERVGSPPLRERMGHSPREIFFGILTGVAVAWLTVAALGYLS